MRYPRLVLLLAAALLLPLPAAASEEAAIREAIGHYFQGHATGDPVHMRKAFMPSAHIEGIRDGKFVSWTADQYISRFTGKPAPDEATRTRTVDSVDVTGDAAMARATLVHGKTTFVDYFVLVKAHGEWKIANKVYNAKTSGETSKDAAPKPSPSPEG